MKLNKSPVLPYLFLINIYIVEIIKITTRNVRIALVTFILAFLAFILTFLIVINGIPDHYLRITFISII